MAMFAAVNAEGSRYIPFRMPRLWGVDAAVSSCRRCPLATIAQPPHDRQSAPHAFADLRHHVHLRREYEVGSRAELDEAEALADFHAVARALPTDDSSGHHAGDLF